MPTNPEPTLVKMELQRTTIIEAAGKRLVEMFFAEQPDPGEGEAQIRFVVSVSAEGYPRLLEVQREALGHVRSVIDIETTRLERVRIGPE